MPAMHQQTYCDFCGSILEPGREFVYQFESLKFLDDEATLAAMRNSELYYGEPLRLCSSCNESVERNKKELEEEAQADRRITRLAQTLLVIGLLATLLGAMLLWLLKGLE
jgi:hypothetical protein